jgi:hypothetical protein
MSKGLFFCRGTLLLFVFGLVLPLSAALVKAEEVSAVILDYGEIEPPAEDAPMASKDSHTGYLHVMNAYDRPRFKPSNDKEHIAVRIGTHFGIFVQVKGGPHLEVVPVRTRWTHPKFSDGAQIEEWDSPMNSGLGRYAGWIMEKQEELLAGDWKVEILYQGKVIAEQTFHISVEAP